jgi:L-iditol 2-dehydrogenase
VAAISGAARLVVVDKNPARLDYARKLGATDVVNVQKQSALDWVRKQTGGRGVNVVITAVPARAVQGEAVQLLAPFGRLSLFAGLPNSEVPVALDTNLIHYRNLLVTGTTGGSPRDYRAAIQLIQTGRIPAAKIVSDTVPIQQLDRAYQLALSGRRLKIVLTAETSAPQAPGRKSAKASHAAATRRRSRFSPLTKHPRRRQST